MSGGRGLMAATVATVAYLGLEARAVEVQLSPGAVPAGANLDAVGEDAEVGLNVVRFAFVLQARVLSGRGQESVWMPEWSTAQGLETTRAVSPQRAWRPYSEASL